MVSARVNSRTNARNAYAHCTSTLSESDALPSHLIHSVTACSEAPSTRRKPVLTKEENEFDIKVCEKVHAMKACRGEDLYLQSSLSSALDGDY